MSLFQDMVTVMEQMNFFHLFLPWLLVLAVSYGALTKYNTISDEESVNGVIALTLAFLTIGGAAMFIPPGMFPHFVGAISFGILGIIGFLILMAVGGFNLDKLEELDRNPLAGFGIAVGIIAFVGVVLTHLEFDFLPDVTEIVTEINLEELYPLFILVFLLVVVVAATRGE